MEVVKEKGDSEEEKGETQEEELEDKVGCGQETRENKSGNHEGDRECAGGEGSGKKIRG